MTGPRAAQQPEFSRPVEVDRVGPEGVRLEIEADPTERAALARRFGLVGLDRLTAAATIAPVSRTLFRVEARFEAEATQTCVVTLEPVPARLSESFSALFGEGGPGQSALLASGEDEDEPEPIEGGVIDVAETVAQHLALALDPYPRKPGASLPSTEASDEAGAGAKPFAGLEALKARRER